MPASFGLLAFWAALGKLALLKFLRAFFVSRVSWAMGAGLVLALAFPKAGVAGLAWVAPALILMPACGLGGKRAFRTGWFAGLAHYLASLYWLLLIPVPWTWAWSKVLGWLALAAFLGLFIGMWTWLSWKIFPAATERSFRDAKVEHRTSNGEPSEKREQQMGTSAIRNLGSAVPRWAAWFLSVPWSLRLSWVVGAAALWVAMEMVIARIFGGFPWNLLGDSQYRMTPLIQVASYTGVYGVSFLVAWSALSLLGAAAVVIHQPVKRSAWVGELILPMLAVTALYVAGYVKLLREDQGRPTLKVALVQPSIPQTIIWDEAEAEAARRFRDLLRISEEALTNKVKVLIWPESAVPFEVREYPGLDNPILALAHDRKVWIILNSDDEQKLPTETNYFNSAFLVSPEGKLIGDYKKQHLVIFGEYVPLARSLPFLKWVTPITGGFTPGDRTEVFDLTNLHVRTSVLICYEDVFPQLARKAVDEDTDFLVNLTNDGWFGKGAAQWQHAATAVFRTVENNVPLVRCTNTGLTCWIDACGRMREKFVSARDGVYGPGYMIAEIPLLFPDEKRVPTFYHQHGDWFGWACVMLAGVRVVGSQRRKAADEPANEPVRQ